MDRRSFLSFLGLAPAAGPAAAQPPSPEPKISLRAQDAAFLERMAYETTTAYYGVWPTYDPIIDRGDLVPPERRFEWRGEEFGLDRLEHFGKLQRAENG